MNLDLGVLLELNIHSSSRVSVPSLECLCRTLAGTDPYHPSSRRLRNDCFRTDLGQIIHQTWNKVLRVLEILAFQLDDVDA